MKEAAMAVALAVLSSTSVFPQQRQQSPTIEDSVADFYVSEFQRAVNVNLDVYIKAKPLIKEFIQTRFSISARRQDMTMQLRIVLNNPKSTDQEIKQAIRDLDKVDSDMQANQDRFLSNIDPLLTTRQQGRVRLFLQNTDQKIRQMLNSVKNPDSPNK
jgi:hypothetical protein